MQDKIPQKYLTPSNCKRLNVVQCNPGMFKNTSQRARIRESGLQGVQKNILKGLTAISSAFDTICPQIQDPQLDSVKETIADGIALVANGSHSLDVFRRQSFRSELREEYSSMCTGNYPVMGFLFGKDVQEKNKRSERVAACRPLNKTLPALPRREATEKVLFF